jgi:dTDP-4-amino-4,6-dideoxygalactose transaminase
VVLPERFVITEIRYRRVASFASVNCQAGGRVKGAHSMNPISTSLNSLNYSNYYGNASDARVRCEDFNPIRKCSVKAGKPCGIRFTPNLGTSLCEFIQYLTLPKHFEIIVSILTPPTLLSILEQAGAEVVFADIDPSTFQLSPRSTERAITKNTRAVLASHQFGSPCNVSELSEIAKRYNLILIEDCTQANGATFFDEPVGNFGDISLFYCENCHRHTQSRYGGGGAIFIREPAMMRFVSLANALDGFFSPFNKEASQCFRENCIVQRDQTAQTKSFANLYTDCLRMVSEIQLPGLYEHSKPIWSNFPIRVQSRPRLLAALGDRGVALHIPEPRFDCTGGLDSPTDGIVKFGPRISESIVLLPVDAQTTEEDVIRISSEIEAFYTMRHRKRWPLTIHYGYA